MAKAKLSLDELLSSTREYFKKRFPSGRKTMPKVTRLVWTPFVGVKTLSARSEVKGDDGKKYKVILTFEQVSYSDTKDSKHTVKFKMKTGKIVYMRPISKRNKVRIRCSCRDFYFRGAYYVWQAGSLYGIKPKKYVRKTKDWPSVNPAKAPMMCKHLLATYFKVVRSNKMQ